MGEAERRRLTGRAGVVALGTLGSRVLGLVRDLVMAALFPRAVVDAFMLAFTLPNNLRQLLAEGAVQNAVVPVLSATREQAGPEAAREYFRAVRGLSLALLFGVSAAGVLLARPLVWLVAVGYREEPVQLERTVMLTRLVFPYIFFMGTAALGAAALNVSGRFAVAAFAPALLNVAFILCSFALPDTLVAHGADVSVALGIAVLLGGALQVLAQWPALRRVGYFQRPRLDLSHPGVRDTLRRMAPLLFGIGVYVLDVQIARSMLTSLGEGAQSSFGWAMRLCDFPQGIFVMALQSATLPSLAKLVARGEEEELSKTFAYGLRLALFVSVPATALLVGLAEPVVTAAFQRGYFDAEASRETARSLMAQGLGVWVIAAVRQVLGLYFALGDTRTPVVVAALDFLVFVGAALALRGPWGHVGLSLAVTLAGAVQLGLLLWLLRRRGQRLRGREVLVSALRTLAATLPALALARWAAQGLGGSTTTLGKLLPGLVGVGVFGVGFLLLAAALRLPELEATLAPLGRRWRARRARLGG